VRDAPQEGSGRWRWIVPPLVLAGTAALTAAVALLVLDAGSGEDAEAPATPPSPATAEDSAADPAVVLVVLTSKPSKKLWKAIPRYKNSSKKRSPAT
jgi:hypothetical protein